MFPDKQRAGLLVEMQRNGCKYKADSDYHSSSSFICFALYFSRKYCATGIDTASHNKNSSKPDLSPSV
jgi:hypothetical protein